MKNSHLASSPSSCYPYHLAVIQVTHVTKAYLTDLAIRKLPFTGRGQARFWDDQLPGFGITVGTRTKTFMVKHQNRLTTLGRYPDISLQDARKAAKRILAHPTPEKRTMSLTDALTAYLTDCETRLRPNTLKEYRRHLDKAPNKSLSALTRHDVDLHEPQAITAWKAFGNWCVRHEYLDRNPFQFLTAKFGQRSRVLTPEELKAVWHYDRPPYSDIVKLLILTGQRVGEIAKLERGWVDGDTLTIPASVAKNGRTHTIPLAPRSAEMIAAAPLPYRFNGWSKAKKRLDEHSGVGDWVIHDIRRSYATIHASLGTPVVITEKLLNHVSGSTSGIVGIYQRYDYMKEMREAQLRYEAHIATIVGT